MDFFALRISPFLDKEETLNAKSGNNHLIALGTTCSHMNYHRVDYNIDHHGTVSVEC